MSIIEFIKKHPRAIVGGLGCAATWLGVSMLVSTGWALVGLGVLTIIGTLLSMLD